MGTHIMKTTIDINDELARRAKVLARKQGTTLRSIVEQGIRLTLDQAARTEAYRLEDKSVRGRGLQQEFKRSAWLEIRETAYGDRGR